MTSFSGEMASLEQLGLLPNSKVTSYKNPGEFWLGLAKPAYLPIANGLAACFYAVRAIWSVLRTVGNLVICKPMAASDALSDLSVEVSLGLLMGVMAPINLLCSAMEFMFNIASCWIAGKEITDDLSKKNWFKKFATDAGEVEHLLPSSKYFMNRFFNSYKDVGNFLGGVFYTAGMPIETGFHSLHHALRAVENALNCIANVIIARPLHAQECFRDTSVDLSLTLSLAIMTPINALVQGIEVITRLGTTWVSACMEGEDPAYRGSGQII
ncbi:Dot/Icm secretion system substrate [Legionella donaldsonii]|uniref:Dot/Icm secretion system substrate n=1 Tax=Legionella donaldsonii TaxID=45060 RepID=A0A378JAD7_9GAMM|nr:type IV secretion protein Dot [Legionella donaldsonii]STX44439.1 Dot/Icm secretion system substrate [Legionella donaldsonii]